VTLPDAISIRDAERVAGLLERHGLPHPMLIVNRVLPVHEKAGSPVSAGRIAETLHLRLLGVVPEDDRVREAVSLGRPAVPGQSPAAKEFARIAKRLLGQEIPIAPVTKPGFFQRLFGGRSIGD